MRYQLTTLAIVVNYHSAALTLGAVQSLLKAESLGPLRVAVVDNSESDLEAEQLRANLPSTVNLEINSRNKGFGRACNKAFAVDQSRAVLLLNPDARLLPKALKCLQETLFSTRKVAAVGPRLFWDESLEYYFPPPCPPDFLEFQPLFQSRGGAKIAALLDVLWRWYAIGTWQSKSPLRVGNLSGGLVLLKRRSVEDAGGLFDPRFFLYFEDTDLFVRLKKAGYNLLLDPRAQAAHYYNQCEKENPERKEKLMLESMALFSDKYPNTRKRFLVQALARVLRPARKKCPHWTHRFSSPFSLTVPQNRSKQWLFEWSPNPSFMPAAMRFGSGPKMEFKRKHWNMLAPGRYYGRMGGIKGFHRHFHRITWEVK